MPIYKDEDDPPVIDTDKLSSPNAEKARRILLGKSNDRLITAADKPFFDK
jgi:hypothetical protein